jgi:SPRY domain-containing SOCS box protein 1/4
MAHPAWYSLPTYLAPLNTFITVAPSTMSIPNRDNQKPPRLDTLLAAPPVSDVISINNTWNPDDCSSNVFVRHDDRYTVHRRPILLSTDCIRGRTGHDCGLHAWELIWSVQHRGSHAVVGVATQDAPLHAAGYQSLVGDTADSWGWDLVHNRLYHDFRNVPGVTYPVDNGNFEVPDKIIVILDMDEGTLSFSAEGRFLGVAFRGGSMARSCIRLSALSSDIVK